ncbi:hypothetical protein ACFLWR_06990 [Chloroflexota bacterium]
MFDSREVSWFVATARIIISLIIIVAILVALDIVIYLQATGSSFDERTAAAFRDAYDYGYEQTYEVAFSEARDVAFDIGYNKGTEIILDIDDREPAEVGRLVEAHNPTYKELNEFLDADETDTNLYVRGEYVCFDYSAELNNNADTAGIRAAYVRIRSEDWGHALVAFNTTDKGLIFIEPQSDVEVKLELGKPYPWQQIKATSPLGYSDPILEIQIIW